MRFSRIVVRRVFQLSSGDGNTLLVKELFCLQGEAKGIGARCRVMYLAGDVARIGDDRLWVVIVVCNPALDVLMHAEPTSSLKVFVTIANHEDLVVFGSLYFPPSVGV